MTHIPHDLPELISDDSSESNESGESGENDVNIDNINDNDDKWIGDYQYDSDEDNATDNDDITQQIEDIHAMGLSPRDLLTALLMWQLGRMNNSNDN